MFNRFISNSYLLHMSLEEAGLPVDGVCIDSRRIDWSPETTQEEKDQGASRLAAFNTLELVASSQQINRLVSGGESGPDHVATITSPLGTAWNYTVNSPDGNREHGSLNDGSLEFSATVSGKYVIEAYNAEWTQHGYAVVEVL